MRHAASGRLHAKAYLCITARWHDRRATRACKEPST
jgi:hypothetical protein